MTKYNWQGVPKHVKYIATDSSGRVWGYSEMPEQFSFSWVSFKGVTAVVLPSNGGVKPYKGNWKESLEERPNE